MERVLVLIKPDAMAKNLAGIVIHDLSNLNLKMIGLKLVKVSDELAKNIMKSIKTNHFSKI